MSMGIRGDSMVTCLLLWLMACAATGATLRRTAASLQQHSLHSLPLYDSLDDSSDLSKRLFDDYGHMRFGKRAYTDDKFDDYGHMRFGR